MHSIIKSKMSQHTFSASAAAELSSAKACACGENCMLGRAKELASYTSFVKLCRFLFRHILIEALTSRAVWCHGCSWHGPLLWSWAPFRVRVYSCARLSKIPNGFLDSGLGVAT